MNQETILQKANRFVKGDRVKKADAQVFYVQGDNDTYIVIVEKLEDGSERTYCTCPAGQVEKHCSHVLAAMLIIYGKT